MSLLKLSIQLESSLGAVITITLNKKYFAVALLRKIQLKFVLLISIYNFLCRNFGLAEAATALGPYCCLICLLSVIFYMLVLPRQGYKVKIIHFQELLLL